MVHGQNFRANGNIFIYFNVLIFYKSKLLNYYFLNKKGFTAQGLFTVKRSTSAFLLILGIQTYKTAIIIIVVMRMIINNYWMRFLRYPE